MNVSNVHAAARIDKGTMMNSDSNRRNGPFWYATLTVCVVAALVVGCGDRRSRQQTDIGNTLLNIGRIAEARQAFERALEANPENNEAELGLAHCLAAQDNLEEALTRYRRVIERDPAEERAYVEGVRILLRRERAGEARELAQAYESVDPENGGMLHAFVLRSTGQTEQAMALLEELAQQFPQSAGVRISLATAQIAADEDAAAIETLEGILENIDPDSLSARMKLVEVYQKQGNLDAIVAQFREMVEQSPNDLGLQLALARSLVDQSEYAEAEEIARTILSDFPESGWANYVVGACLVAREQYHEAVPYLQAASQALPEFEVVRERLALARRGGVPAPVAETERPSVAIPDADPATLSWQQLWQQARLDTLLEQSASLLANDEPNLRETLVLAALFSGDRVRATELSEGLPEDSPLNALLAALESRDSQAAVEVFEQWQETDLARALLRDNAYGFTLVLVGARARALQELSDVYATTPDHAVALYNIATIYRTARLPEYATQILDRLLALYPNNHGARRLLLQLLVDANDLDRARAVAELTYQLYPTDPQFVVDLARIYRSTGQINLARNVLNSALGTIPESGALRVAKARVQLIEGLADDALKTLEGHTFNEDEFAASEALRAFALAEKNDWAAVAAACEGVPADMRSLGLHLLFAAALLHTADTDAAAAALEQAGDVPWHRIDGGGAAAAAIGVRDPVPGTEDFVGALKANPEAFAAYVCGVACLAESFPDSALAAFEKAAEHIADAPVLTVLMLDAAAGVAQLEDPVEKARALARRTPNDARTWLAKAEFHRRKGNAEAELAAINRAIELDENNAAGWLLLARRKERVEEDKPAALAAYERAVALRQNDPIVNNNLAYLILETDGDIDRALELASAALEQAEHNPIIQPHILHTLGLAELRARKLDDAELHLGLALQMRPGDPTLLLDFGALLIEKGDKEAGQRHVQLALEYASRLGLDFPRKAEAERLVAAETS